MRKTVFLTIAAVIVAEVVVALLFAYSGLVNVAAVGKEGNISKWFLTSVRDKSIGSRSGDIAVPALTDSSLLAKGFDYYNEMCVTCHGAPGHEPDELAQGLNPPAPLFAHTPSTRSAAETFWIIKNGIKMTGMAAFGPTHSDSLIWGMAAVVRQLASMTPEMYTAKTKGSMNMDMEMQGMDRKSEGEKHHR